MEDFDAERMGDRIRSLRQGMGLTQEDVAGKLRVKRETYNTIAKLAGILCTTTDFILRGNNTHMLSAAEATGLSDDALAKLQKWKNDENNSAKPLSPFSISFDHIHMLEILITQKEGNYFLECLQDYLDCDYSQSYIEEKNGDLTPLEHDIVFKNIDGTHTYFATELFADVIVNHYLPGVIKRLKESYMKGRNK